MKFFARPGQLRFTTTFSPQTHHNLPSKNHVQHTGKPGKNPAKTTSHHTGK
jgi:hypothetical protein